MTATEQHASLPFATSTFAAFTLWLLLVNMHDPAALTRSLQIEQFNLREDSRDSSIHNVRCLCNCLHCNSRWLTRD